MVSSFLVSTTLDVLPPPSVQCRQMTVSGKHLTVLKGRTAAHAHTDTKRGLLLFFLIVFSQIWISPKRQLPVSVLSETAAAISRPLN